MNERTPVRQLTLGVLGHVDHGKTALVRALTGIETDRLAEERERGLSIVAGYAFVNTDEVCIDLIDAPGHQAFIRAMIGAASGIDAALLVIAANEGVMPQTREHVAIAGLLGVSTGVVCLTKCDLVDAQELVDREAEVREFLQSTFLEGAAVVRVSAQRSEGMQELRDALTSLRPAQPLGDGAPFFMPVDRSFSMSGFGRITTGTVHAAAVRRGDELVAVPGGGRVSVRGIQVHGRDAAAAFPGQRAALNLRTASDDPIRPGAILGHEYAAQSARRLDVVIEPLPEFADALRNGAQLRVLLGTAEAQARLRLLEREDVSDQRKLLAQLRCDREIGACPGMRFILRENSPGVTVAGGIVVDPAAPRRRRFDKSANTELGRLATAGRAAAFERIVFAAGAAGLDRERAARRLCVAPETIDALAAGAAVVAITPQLFCARATVEALESQIIDVLQRYHSDHPQHAGIRHADLAGALGSAVHEAIARAACDRLCARCVVAATGNAWRLASFDPVSRLSKAQRQLAERMEKLFAAAGINAQKLSSIVTESPAARETLRFLIETGRVVALQTRDRNNQLAVHADSIREVQARIQNRYPYPSEFAVSDIRDLLGTTRKHAVPLLEHLDATGFTLRRGDLRQIRKTGGE